MATFKPRFTCPEPTNPYYVLDESTQYVGYNVGCRGNTKKGHTAYNNILYSALPNCVGYSWGRYIEALAESTTDDATKRKYQYYKVFDASAGGGDMFFSAPARLKVQRGPAVGCIACWTGHVANVEQVNPDGSIIVSHSGWGYSKGTMFPEPVTFETLYPPNYWGGDWLGSGDYAYTFRGFIYPDVLKSDGKTYGFDKIGTSIGDVPAPEVGGTNQLPLVTKDDVCSENRHLPDFCDEQKNNATYVYSWLTNKGWTHNAIVATLGNMMIESRINPGRWQGGVGPAFGIVQWDPPSKLTEWAIKKYGISSGDYTKTGAGNIDYQLERIQYELGTGEQWDSTYSYAINNGKWRTSITYKDFNTNESVTISCESPKSMTMSQYSESDKSIGDLVQYFLWGYERPGDGDVVSRVAYAMYWNDYFRDYVVGGGSSLDRGCKIFYDKQWRNAIPYIFSTTTQDGVTTGKWSQLKYNVFEGELWKQSSQFNTTGPLVQSTPSTGKTSDEGVNLIKTFEGFYEYKYFDYKQDSVGYGSRYEPGMPQPMPEPYAANLLKQLLSEKYEGYVEWVANTYDTKFSQNQFDALVSFVYNLGNVFAVEESKLRSILMSKEHEQYGCIERGSDVDKDYGERVKAAFGEYVHAGGKVVTGLVNRRRNEAECFLYGDYVNN